ncbi:hypothetical protein [Saccharibacillus sp. JS10]|uniref:hypothetical protein n=1 Tax=Saccharibacillus sp. JS10 TaxID=2950552 RepID=UPI00210A3B5E|nr:hypothetical protein [Saccharibacillus sp. JS10]MCQ4087453.1 hypothetical protein [Saccharibacillus sp. JS10]
MTLITLGLLLGTALLISAGITFIVLRRKKISHKSKNIIDLAEVRRLKMLQSSAQSSMAIEAPKRKVSSANGAEVRGFVPKNSPVRNQTCTRCHKQSESVGFYVDQYGNLVGVCRECRKSAKNRDLMPL